MRIDYVCPACEGVVEAPASLEGSSADCPECKAKIKRWPPPRWKSNPKPLSLDDKPSPNPIEVGDSGPQGSSPQPGVTFSWSVEYVAAMVFAVLVTILGGIALYKGFSPMKAHIDDPSDRWEREIESRNDRQFAGVVFIAAGLAGACVVYVEAFKSAVRQLIPFTNRTIPEVLAILGTPTMTLSHEDGTVRYGWKVLWYSLVLGFRDGKCVGVLAEGNLG